MRLGVHVCLFLVMWRGKSFIGQSERSRRHEGFYGPCSYPSIVSHSFPAVPMRQSCFSSGLRKCAVCGMLLWLCPQNNTVQRCATTIWIVSAATALFYRTFFLLDAEKCGYLLNMKNMALVSNIFILVNLTRVKIAGVDRCRCDNEPWHL